MEVDNEEGGTIGLFHTVKKFDIQMYWIVQNLHSTKTMQRICEKQTGVRRATF